MFCQQSAAPNFLSFAVLPTDVPGSSFPQTASPILHSLSSVPIGVVDSVSIFGGNVLRQAPVLLFSSDIDFDSFCIRGRLPLAPSSFEEFALGGSLPPDGYILLGNGKGKIYSKYHV